MSHPLELEEAALLELLELVLLVDDDDEDDSASPLGPNPGSHQPSIQVSSRGQSSESVQGVLQNPW